MIVIVTEKPSAARQFANALGGMTGKFKGKSYKIVHAVGHIYQFPEDPSKLAGEKYKSWSWKSIPWNPDDFKWKKYQVKGMKDVVSNIKNALEIADEVVIATDNDPSGEGEMIFWEIADALKWKGKTSRAYFIDESKKEILKAMEKRVPIENMMKDGDYLKADTRSKFDYLSMQLTRAATLSLGGRKMVVRQGRLKSVMVYLVGQQLDLVKNYVRKPFYTARYKDENGHVYKRKKEDCYETMAEVSL